MSLKKIIALKISILFSSSIFAIDQGIRFCLPPTHSTFDTSAGVLTVPFIEINGSLAYQNVLMRVNAEDKFEVVDARTVENGEFIEEVVDEEVVDEEVVDEEVVDEEVVDEEITFPYTETLEISTGVGSLFTLSDGSLWAIRGGPGFLSITVTRPITIYFDNPAIADPDEGQRTAFFLLIDGVGRPYFVEPI